MKLRWKVILFLAAVFSIFLVYSIISSNSTVRVIDNPLNEPPETYAGQVIIKYTINYKEDSSDGMPLDESTLSGFVTGTIYPLYTQNYFTGTYLFKEGQISWNYNSKRYSSTGSCDYLTTSAGSGNIDIGHTDQIYYDSKIWLENYGEEYYIIDINNAGRFYLAGDGLPIAEGDYDSAVKPVQATTQTISGNPSFCSSGSQTNEVPPEITIRLDHVKATNNILSGDEVLYPSTGVKEMISYTIELPPVKADKTAPEPDVSADDASDKQSFMEIFWNWVKSLFGRK